MKESVTAHQNGCFCNIGTMCACALWAIGPCVEMVEFGRKPVLPCTYPYFLFQVVMGTAFAFFAEKTSWT